MRWRLVDGTSVYLAGSREAVRRMAARMRANLARLLGGRGKRGKR